MQRLDHLLRVLAFAIAVNLSSLAALAVNPDEMLDDPVLEERARDLSAIIRCMKCQNQSIDDSDAELARDLRILVRDRLKQGDSDQQVLNYLVDRYGEFVLLRPVFSLSNLVLWLAPVFALFAGLFLAWRFMTSRKSQREGSSGSLTSDEHARLTKILDESD